MSDLQITLKTLTPLWTGGADRNMDRVHETGILGSLRWWYEALVRGMGGYACDPTDGGCVYDPKQGEKSICTACHVFGCTGWARRFRLSVDTSKMEWHPLHFYSGAKMNRKWLSDIFAGTGNSLDALTVLFGDFIFGIVDLSDDDFAVGQLEWAIKFAADYGGIGAKLQHGFGTVRIVLGSNDDNVKQAKQHLKTQLQNFKSADHPQNSIDSPNTKNFVSLVCKMKANHFLLPLKDQKYCVGKRPNGEVNYIPCAFDLRTKSLLGQREFGLRKYLLAQVWSKDDVALLMGESKPHNDDDRTASRICVSMPFIQNNNWMLRIYGFAPNGFTREEIQGVIKAYAQSIDLEVL